jgi:hypothetical protein
MIVYPLPRQDPTTSRGSASGTPRCRAETRPRAAREAGIRLRHDVPMTNIDGRRVSGVGLGTAPLAFRGGSDAEAVATVRAALDAGVGLIDTALAELGLPSQSR